MENKADYIARLQVAIEHLHKCAAVHAETVPVREVFQGKVIWDGEVEAFALLGHAKAKRCYAWTHGEPEEFMTVLEIPPVDSPQSAVKVATAYQIKQARK